MRNESAFTIKIRLCIKSKDLIVRSYNYVVSSYHYIQAGPARRCPVLSSFKYDLHRILKQSYYIGDFGEV